ncbi:MAG: class I SAM-dependent methyltransferase [Betaproteobacteria bacterium HGW-Betaproteobacteria-14]|nr:MAG: class I SAM-dependent methyltransferase [Betaproteobacteria bacterium HGW-Betaproteobacteria-14]
MSSATMRSEPTFTQKSWASLRTALIGCGLAEPLLRRGLLGLEETRRRLALHHLPAGGRGLEIGPLHCPLPLPPGARARYVDHHTAGELRRLRDDAGAGIVDTDILTDGFTLGCIAAASQDFVVANHVLEHATDALGTLENWLRVLRPGGVLFVAVPIGACCFDRGRAVTTPQHFLDDRRLSASGDSEAMRERNRVHVEEHLDIAAPALARGRGEVWTPLQGEAREREIARLLGADASQVHHHVFTPESFAALLGLLGPAARIERVARSSIEIVGIVSKRS